MGMRRNIFKINFGTIVSFPPGIEVQEQINQIKLMFHKTPHLHSGIVSDL
jgi:hypothetical protein